MSAAVTIAAFPVAYLVLRALLRSRLGGRLVAEPTGERWHDQVTPSFGGVGIFLGLLAGLGAAVATGTVDASSELLGVTAGCTILFRPGSPTTCASCCRSRSSARSSSPRGSSSRAGSPSR